MSKAQTVLTAFRASRDACPKLEGVSAALERVHRPDSTPLDLLFGRGLADQYAALGDRIVAARVALDELLGDALFRNLCDVAFASFADRPVNGQDEVVHLAAVEQPMVSDNAGQLQAPIDTNESAIHRVSPDNGRAA